MKRRAHPFVPAALLLLAALALATLPLQAAPAAASPADLSSLFCTADRSVAEPAAQGLTPTPEPMISAPCGCNSDALCQGHNMGFACKVSGGMTYRCLNLTGHTCVQFGVAYQQCSCTVL